MQPKLTALVVTTWRDASGSQGSAEVNHPHAEIATVESRAATLAARLSACSDCSLTGYNIIYNWFDNAAPAPAGFQIVQLRMVLVFRCDGDEQYYVMNVPGVKLTLLEDTLPSIYIDTTLPQIVNLVDYLITLGVCNPLGYPIVELINAYVEFIP